VIQSGYGFFSGYTRIDKDPRIPSGHIGFITICSITMDGVLERMGIPVRVVYGGRLEISKGKAIRFLDLIRYRGTTINPLQLFISAGLTSVHPLIVTGSGVGLVNIRTVPIPAAGTVQEMIPLMKDCGFRFPLAMGNELLNLPPDPYRLSVVSHSGMNLIAHGVELGYSIKTEIGAGTIPFSRIKSAI
jgi:repressor of nif and glnA expression